MNFNPQYKVIDPYNYDRIIHNIEKKYAKREDMVRQMERCIQFKKLKNCAIR